MSRNIDTMLRFVEAQNNHDSAAVTACFAPDFKRRSAETQWQEMGVGNYADMSDRYWAAFPDTHFEIQHLMEDGNFVFLQYMETGTWTGTWEMPGGISIPPQNSPYQSLGLITCEMNEDGLIRRYCYYTQNGCLPPTARNPWNPGRGYLTTPGSIGLPMTAPSSN